MLREEALKAALDRVPIIAAEGTAYRVIPARHYLTALSSIGSFQRGGRYNPRGRLEALYLSESPITALQEVDAIQQTSGSSRLTRQLRAEGEARAREPDPHRECRGPRSR